MRARAGATKPYFGGAAVILCSLLGALPPAHASTAYFSDGRGLTIEDAWRVDDWIYLRLPGGGVVATEASRVARVHLTPLAPEAPMVADPTTDPGLSEGPAAPLEPPLGGTLPAAAIADSPSVDALIQSAAAMYDLDEKLVRAVVRAESGFNPRAVSRVGAQGLMQLMPATAAAMEVRDPFDPADNLAGGVRYLKWMMLRFEGRLELALAAYNAGPAAVERHGGIPPFAETRAYVERVLAWASR